MKKTLAIVLIILSFFIIYFFQANFFSWFTIAGVMPNLFVILVLFVSLYGGTKIGITSGILMGAYLDIVIEKTMGPSIIMLGVVGVVGGYFDKNFSKESKLTTMLMIIGSTCIYEIGAYIIQIAQLSIYVEVTRFMKILLIEVIYNSTLTIIFYPLMKKLGYKLEDTFKGQEILTRYF